MEVCASSRSGESGHTQNKIIHIMKILFSDEYSDWSHVNLREKILPRPGFEPESPTLRAGALSLCHLTNH